MAREIHKWIPSQSARNAEVVMQNINQSLRSQKIPIQAGMGCVSGYFADILD